MNRMPQKAEKHCIHCVQIRIKSDFGAAWSEVLQAVLSPHGPPQLSTVQKCVTSHHNLFGFHFDWFLLHLLLYFSSLWSLPPKHTPDFQLLPKWWTKTLKSQYQLMHALFKARIFFLFFGLPKRQKTVPNYQSSDLNSKRSTLLSYWWSNKRSAKFWVLDY